MCFTAYPRCYFLGRFWGWLGLAPDVRPYGEKGREKEREEHGEGEKKEKENEKGTGKQKEKD